VLQCCHCIVYEPNYAFLDSWKRINLKVALSFLSFTVGHRLVRSRHNIATKQKIAVLQLSFGPADPS
jgi:hypothetical protein